MDELLSGAQFISTLDLTKGYWQAPLLDPGWTLAVPGPSLRTPWGPRNVPAYDRHSAPAPPGLRGSTPGQRRHPLEYWRKPSYRSVEGAAGVASGWYHS